MRKIVIGLIIALTAITLHWVAMGIWSGQHEMPFHSGKAMLTCPMGYVCPISPAALRMALTAPSPETFKGLAPLLLAVIAFLFAAALERARYRPPLFVPSPASPSGLRSIFKRE